MHPKIQHWKSHWDRFSERHLEWMLGAGFASLLLGSFLKISFELRKNTTLPQMDLLILEAVSVFRTPFLTHVALNVTTLGSGVLLGLFCAIVIVLLFGLRRDRWGALQMAVASAGSGLWVHYGKNTFKRIRPEALHALVIADGYSYPSGHSLSSAAIYLTAALLLCRGLASKRKRWTVMALAIGLICLIGFTRIYLGVHFPSDVASGLLLGAAWAFLLEAARTYLRW